MKIQLIGSLINQETTYLGNSGIGLTPWKEKLIMAENKVQLCLDAVKNYRDATVTANPTN